MNLPALETIRTRWLYLLTGQGAPASAQPMLAPLVEILDANADKLLARQIWNPGQPDHGNLTGQPLSHAQFTFGTHYLGDVCRVATAWACPFSRHYHRPETLERCLAALRFGERYVRPDQPRDGSWYMWDIGFPRALAQLVVLLDDQLPADLRDLIREDLAHLPTKVFTLDRQRGIVRPPLQSGANNLEILHVGLFYGLALRDPQWLDTVTAQVPVAMGRATGSEGLQADWSYHFHGHGVNAGYGLAGLATQAQWLYLTQGTPWQLPAELRELHVSMIREFFARNFWRGRVAPYSVDRGIATPGGLYARGFLTTLLLGLLTDLPANDRAVFAAAAADYLRGLDPDGNPVRYNEPETITEASLLPALLLTGIPQPIQADPRILGGIRYYPCSEYLLVRQSEWFAAIRMSSGMTSTWKSMLGMNLHGSSSAEFSIALMTDGREFDHTTIPTMNWKRLMGVTRCDAIEPPPEGYGQSAFCGGLAGDDLAVLGLQYLLAPAGQDTLRANKSVFVTPDALILLGSQIRCDSAEPVFTTLFHAPLLQDDLTSRPVRAGETLRIRNVTIRLLCDAELIVETRRGSYNDLNHPQRHTDSPTYERRWVYLIVNHGVRPTNGRYGAILTLGRQTDFRIQHDDFHHRVDAGRIGAEVRFPGDWRKPIGCSYWGAEQHQWGSIARWVSDTELEITAPRRFVRSEQANTEIFLPAGFEQETVTLKTYAGDPFPKHIFPTSANGKVHKLHVRRRE